VASGESKPTNPNAKLCLERKVPYYNPLTQKGHFLNNLCRNKLVITSLPERRDTLQLLKNHSNVKDQGKKHISNKERWMLSDPMLATRSSLLKRVNSKYQVPKVPVFRYKGILKSIGCWSQINEHTPFFTTNVKSLSISVFLQQRELENSMWHMNLP
jgi:hypothetical protein